MGKLAPCACRSFEFGEFDGDNENAVSYDTNCGQSTTRVFAQGHDAKLVGFAVRAEMAGEEIRMVDGGVAITFPGAVAAMARISDALADKAQAQLDAARARLAKKELTEAKKAARKSAKKVADAEAKPATRKATIKRGRWTYAATIDTKTQWAAYTNRKGELINVASTDYTEV